MKFKNKVKKVIALSAAIAMVCGGLTGCGENGKENTENKVSISIGNWPSQETKPKEYETYEGYVNEMKEKYPDIEIIQSDFAYSEDTFLPMAASGQLPTLYRVPFTEPQKLIDAGYARDITDAAKEHGITDALEDSVRNLVTKDGKIYGVPYYGYIMGIGCNAALFKEAGLVDEDGAPKQAETYVELAEMAKTIKDKTGQSGFTLLTSGATGGWVFMNIAWSYGVNFMEKADGKWKATFNTPEAAAAMQYVSDLKWKYDVLPSNVLVDQPTGIKFLGVGQTAMEFLSDDWVVDTLVESYKMNKEDIAYMSLPGGPGGRYGQMGGDIWMISNTATDEQVDACLKWIALKGEGPTLTDDSKANLEKSLIAKQEQGYAVFKPSFSIWKNEDRVKTEEEIYAKYANVSPKMFRNLTDGVTPREEEPMYGQQLYSILSSIMQEVLTNQNADIPALLEEANSNFQRDFLDKIE